MEKFLTFNFKGYFKIKIAIATNTIICVHFKYNPIFLWLLIYVEILPAKIAIVENISKETNININPNT